MPRKLSRDNEEERDMTLTKKGFRRFLTDSERIKDSNKILRSAPHGKYMSLEEWEAMLEEDS